MKYLYDILPDDADFGIMGTNQVLVGGFTLDSREANDRTAFVARKGSKADGHDFISHAITNGCKLIFCENKPEIIQPEVTYVVCHNLPMVLGRVLRTFYNGNLENLVLVGVTGTNGKTTVARLLFELFCKLGYRCGLISTVENIVVDEVMTSTHTTPDQLNLYALLNRMAEKNCKYVFMEVSSHAIHQQRIAGLKFTAAIFTNITHDHLDYHGSYSEYLSVKKRFFDDLDPDSFAIINKDDPNGMVMVQNTKSKSFTYGFQHLADFKGRLLENSFSGLHLQFEGKEWYARLIGNFNAYNLLAAYVTARCLGVSPDDVLQNLSMLKPVEGRFEYIRHEGKEKTGIVDYAHTPDALEKVLETVNNMKSPGQKVLTVIGCGGDRDKLKRPLMAKIACMLSDQVILTSDNPRSEAPADILRDMENGIINDFPSEKYLVIEDRGQAIKTACTLADENDIVLVAGKGHEKYQEIKGKKLPFDDKKMLNTYL